MRGAVASLQVGVLLLAGLAVAVDLQLAQRLRWPVLVQEHGLTPAAPERGLLEYRMDQAEKGIEAVKHEHGLLTYLLVGNLVGVVASLVTYLLVGRKRSRSG